LIYPAPPDKFLQLAAIRGRVAPGAWSQAVAGGINERAPGTRPRVLRGAHHRGLRPRELTPAC
jgi:hypothetical protein